MLGSTVHLLHQKTNLINLKAMEYNYNKTDNNTAAKTDFAKGVSGKGAVLGILVIAGGLLWLARNTGFLDPTLSRIVFSWEMLLIAIGVVIIVIRQNLWFGIILIAIGGFLLLINFYHMPFSTWQLFWPAIIILFGLKMIFGRSRFDKDIFKKSIFDNTVGSEDFFEDIAIFGGGERKIVTPNFKGGRMIAAFGGSKVDLSHCNIEPGVRPMVEVVSIFGGSSLIVPTDWNVKVEVFNIFGGYADKRIASQVDFNKTVIVKGVTIFGGGEVKSF
jgi:predicted membrane protein